MAYYIGATHTRKTIFPWSKWGKSQLASSTVRCDPVTVFCCCKETLLWEGELSTLSSAGAGASHSYSYCVLLAKEQLHWSCSSATCCSRATWPVYFMLVYFPRPAFLNSAVSWLWARRITDTQHKPSSQEPWGPLVSMLRKVESVSIALIFLWKCCESGVKRQ